MSIRRRNEIWWWKACLWVSSLRSPEKENMGFRFVNFVVCPSSRLLYSDSSPLGLREEFAFMWDFLVNFFGEYDVSVLVVVIKVFF